MNEKCLTVGDRGRKRYMGNMAVQDRDVCGDRASLIS